MKPLQDYSFVRGINFEYPLDAPERWHNDLALGQRVGLNSARIWLSYRHYKENPENYFAKIKQLFHVFAEHGYTVMPIVFNGNDIRAEDPYELDETFRLEGEAYCRAVVAALKDEPNLLMYDVMNEPGCNHLIWDAKDESERQHWFGKHWAFICHFCAYFKQIDPDNAITVGHWLSDYIEKAAELVDVLCYHDYSSSVKGIAENADRALAASRKWGKPVINSETGCIGRGNGYDVVIQTLNERHLPWFIYGLTCDGYWSDICGIFYPDGTVRDPATVAALLGFYRNRNYETIIPEKPNREKLVVKALHRVERLLLDEADDCFQYKGVTADALLDACDELACFLEAGQLVPMRIPPTARVAYFRKQQNPNMLEIKQFAYEMAKALKESCFIL